MYQVWKQETRSDPPLFAFLQSTPLEATEKLPTWMPERNPFVAVNGYLRNHPGIFQYLFEFFVVKLYLGGTDLGGTDLAGVLRDKELKASG